MVEINSKIKGILFDSGRVLNTPVSGHWMITPNFFKFIDKNRFYSVGKSRRKEAFKKASSYIRQQKIILNEEEEYKHFLQYYRIFFHELSELNVSSKKIHLITKDLVYNYDKYKFFDDALKIVPKLNKIYKLAVVSDAWPSLYNVFKKADQFKYFKSFVVSSIIGASKPDKVMYKTALEELNIKASEAIFIDDNIRNCDGAKEVGINFTVLLCRDIKVFIYYKVKCKNHIVIRKLNKIIKLLEKTS